MTFARDHLSRLWCGKVNYPNKEDAMRACRAINARAGGEATAYYCETCKAFHFGRKPIRTTAIKAEKSRTNDEETAMLKTVEKHKSAAPTRIHSTMNDAAQANRELSWLAQRIAKSRDGVFSEIATITPSIAKHILDQNADNRNIRQKIVDRIASDIAGGMWDLNGEAIIVAKSGELNDGQHRLSAIIQANKAVQSNIIFGVDRNSRFTVDMGAVRTTGDFLGMEGAKYRTHAAACAKLLLMFRKGLYGSSGNGSLSDFTSTAIRAEYWKNQKDVDSAVADIINEVFLKQYGGSALIAAHVLIYRANGSEAAFFFNKLATGDQLPRGSAILALRAKMMEVKADRLRPWEKLEIFLRYWNAWRSGVKVQRALSIRRSWPEVSR